MRTCIHCNGRPVKKIASPKGNYFFTCPQCLGTGVQMEVLISDIPEDYGKKVWQIRDQNVTNQKKVES